MTIEFNVFLGVETIQELVLRRPITQGGALMTDLSQFTRIVFSTAGLAIDSATDPTLIYWDETETRTIEVDFEDVAFTGHVLKMVLGTELSDNGAAVGTYPNSCLTVFSAEYPNGSIYSNDITVTISATCNVGGSGVPGVVNATQIQGVDVDATAGTPDDADILVYRSVGSDWVLEPKPASSANPEGTAVLSSGEVGGTKYLREDGDGTCSWQTVAGGGGGDVSKVGTPVDNQIGIWTGDGTLEGSTAATFNGTTFALTGNMTVTGTVDGRDVAADGTELDSFDNDLATFSVPASTTISAFGATLVDDAAASNARTTLGLGTAAEVNTDLADLNEATIESAIDTLANLTSIQGVTVTLADAGADAILGWDDVAGAYENLSAAEARAVINVEDGADVTDETNVVSALDGATLTETAAASGDFFIFQDATDAGAIKKIDFDNMPGAGGGISNVVEDATPQLGGNLDLNSSDITGIGGINITGSISLSGTVDGRDVAADGSKLDNIEASADVTDVTNVTAAGALMDSEVDADLKTFSLPASTTISAFGASIVEDADAATVIGTLGIASAALTLTNKTIDAAGTGNVVSNIGYEELQSELHEMIHSWEGMAFHKPDLFVVDSTGLKFEIENTGGGDMEFWMDHQLATLDCTTGAGVGGRARVALTAGADANTPTTNYLYVTSSGATATLAASTSLPTGIFCWIGKVIVPDATTWASSGEYAIQRYTEAAINNDRGLFSHEREKLRALGAVYISGVGQTLDITVNGGSLDNVHLQTGSGSVYQLHRQSFPAFTTGPYYYGNGQNVYEEISDLNAALFEQDGTAISGDRYNLVIWGAVNYSTGDCKLFVNLPNAVYGNDGAAMADGDNTADYSVPDDMRSVAFMICRLALRHRTISSGTITELGVYSLLGTPAGARSGGAGAVASTEFVDSTFRLYDNGDATKEIAFEASSITTGTTRTVTVPDASGTIEYEGHTHTVSELSDADADLATLSLPASTTISAFGATVVDDADADGVLTTLGLDADLTTFALPGSTTISAFGASLVDDATAAAARVTLAIPVLMGGAASDETTALTTGTAKLTFRMPLAMTVTEVRCSVTTAPTGSVLTVDINESGTSILSTKLTIDATEKTSTTAATAAVISDSALADDAEMTVDIDTVGSTVAGAGLKITLIGTEA